MMSMLQACGAGRTGTPGEITNVVAFLTGPDGFGERDRVGVDAGSVARSLH
ncbi:hypothetical protein [Nonomuraea jabiensis]|uniref:Uncharacterized protein n=1 Tax=Nonomuraea jabiensis TaxID=882448 RepID=A0A7W9FY44_9ACTN|nr:hypothetical protein [Nonomuraea jabiensis]MBB5773663.1 hypothetical protein [Nonomuraea jabiensis]